MRDERTIQGALAAAILGFILWFAVAKAGGRTEPWDTGLYWSTGYPVALAIAAGLGFFFPARAWRWGLILFLMQVPVMIAGGSGFGLLPLGLILVAILSLPAIGAAMLAAALRGTTRER